MQQQSVNSTGSSGALNASLLVIPLSNGSAGNSATNTPPPANIHRKSLHSNSNSGKIIESTSEKMIRSTLLGSSGISDNNSVGNTMQKYWINPASGQGSGNLNFLDDSNDRKSLTPRQYQQQQIHRQSHNHEENQESRHSNHGSISNSSGSNHNSHSNGHHNHNHHHGNSNNNNKGHHSHKSKDTDDLVIIHVYDETRQINRDFSCKRNLLVTHMKYFETFLTENENNNNYEDIDISVHCDVEIFDWLMKYIENVDLKPPILEKSVVISILISSEFLQMDRLVDYCLEFIMSCLSDIIKLPIDLSCISEKLVNRLAALTSPKV